MKISEAYNTMQSASGIKEGDTVKVLRKATNEEMGWQESWAREMSDAIGRSRRVRSVRNSGVLLDDDFRYPFFVLELIDVAPHTITIDGKDIEISHESFTALKSSLEGSL